MSLIVLSVVIGLSATVVVALLVSVFVQTRIKVAPHHEELKSTGAISSRAASSWDRPSLPNWQAELDLETSKMQDGFRVGG